MAARPFCGMGARADHSYRFIRFQRQSSTSGNWERRIPALTPLWRDLSIGIIAGLIIIPSCVLYVAPFLMAVAKAVFAP